MGNEYQKRQQKEKMDMREGQLRELMEADNEAIKELNKIRERYGYVVERDKPIK